MPTINPFDIARDICRREQPDKWVWWYRMSDKPERGEFELIRIFKNNPKCKSHDLFFDALDKRDAIMKCRNIMEEFGMIQDEITAIVESVLTEIRNDWKGVA